MSALSTKDKLKLRLSAQRVERWEIERRKPVNNGIERCKHVAFSSNPNRAEEIIRKDKVFTPEIKMRSGSDKLAQRVSNRDVAHKHLHHEPVMVNGVWRMLTIETIDVVGGGDGSGYTPGEVNEAKEKPRFATPRPDSPFKRAKRAPVVVVKKG